MGPIVHQTSNVVFGHFGKLFLEDAFQTGQDDEVLTLVIIINHSEFNLSIALFDYCRLSNVRGEPRQATKITRVEGSPNLFWKRNYFDQLLLRFRRCCMGILHALASS